MSSTYLDLCQKLAPNVSASGSGPVSVLDQTGEYGRLVQWVADAYADIQLRHDNWRWLRSTWSVDTVPGTDAYAYGAVTDTLASALISRFLRWIHLDDRGYSNVTMYPTVTGVSAERYLIYLPWSDFRYIYKRGVQSTLRRTPVHFTIDPQNRLMLGPNPDGAYTVRGEYQKAPQALAADGDVPEMPSHFHDLVIYRAMEKIATDLCAPEVLQRAKSEGSRLMRALEKSQLPGIGVGDPLA